MDEADTISLSLTERKYKNDGNFRLILKITEMTISLELPASTLELHARSFSGQILTISFRYSYYPDRLKRVDGFP